MEITYTTTAARRMGEHVSLPLRFLQSTRSGRTSLNTDLSELAMHTADPRATPETDKSDGLSVSHREDKKGILNTINPKECRVKQKKEYRTGANRKIKNIDSYINNHIKCT